MADTYDKMRRKVDDIFGEIAGIVCNASIDHARHSRLWRSIAAALKDYGEMIARDIGFHMSDWNSDAAFVVDLHLFPERFTKREIEEGVRAFLIHAPNHIAAAAKLMGYPVEDIFEVGTDSDHSDEP